MPHLLGFCPLRVRKEFSALTYFLWAFKDKLARSSASCSTKHMKPLVRARRRLDSSVIVNDSCFFCAPIINMALPAVRRRWADVEDGEDMTDIHRGLRGLPALDARADGHPRRLALQDMTAPRALEAVAWLYAWHEVRYWPNGIDTLSAWCSRLVLWHWPPIWLAVVFDSDHRTLFSAARFLHVPLPVLLRGVAMRRYMD